MPKKRKLTDEQVRMVLTDERPAREFAQILDVEKTAIQDIRSGRIYKSVLPDIPRWPKGKGRNPVRNGTGRRMSEPTNPGATCYDCVFHETKQVRGYKDRTVRTCHFCYFEFPEVKRPAQGAVYCNCFKPK